MMPKTLFLAAGIAAVAGFATMPNSHVESNPCADAPLTPQLPNLPCENAKVQSGANVTIGAVGLLAADLDPIELPLNKDTCAVNVHWHLGAEHFSADQYDIPAESRRRLAVGGDIREGFNCPAVAAGTEYTWQYCKNMHVGETYEIHWPHSNLGKCGTKWQYQYPFMDGVLCQATEGELTLQAASDAIFTTKAAKIGVLGQVFTVVNDGTDDYDYPMWNMLGGWNPELATDVAVYQGSTTGQTADNDQNCRGTGGMVTWHVDRKCHKVSAKAFDNLCKQMSEIADDMSPDMMPHGSRELVDPQFVSDVIMSRE